MTKTLFNPAAVRLESSDDDDDKTTLNNFHPSCSNGD